MIISEFGLIWLCYGIYMVELSVHSYKLFTVDILQVDSYVRRLDKYLKKFDQDLRRGMCILLNVFVSVRYTLLGLLLSRSRLRDQIDLHCFLCVFCIHCDSFCCFSSR